MRGTQFIIGAILSLSAARALAAPPDGERTSAASAGAVPGASQAVPMAGLPEQSEGRDSCQTNAELARQTDALFEKGKAAYEANDKDESIYWITRAYELSKCHEFLFIIAELHREQAHSCTASRTYRKYVEELPNGRNAVSARQMSEELAIWCEASSAVAGEPPQTPRPQSLPASSAAHPGEAPPPKARPTATSWTAARVVGWASVGVSVIAGVAAIYYVGVEKSTENELEALWQSRVTGQVSPGTWQATSSSLESKGLRAERNAQILGVSAGVLAVGGALLVLWDHGSEKAATGKPLAERVDLQLGPRAVHAGYTVHF